MALVHQGTLGLIVVGNRVHKLVLKEKSCISNYKKKKIIYFPLGMTILTHLLINESIGLCSTSIQTSQMFNVWKM